MTDFPGGTMSGPAFLLVLGLGLVVVSAEESLSWTSFDPEVRDKMLALDSLAEGQEEDRVLPWVVFGAETKNVSLKCIMRGYNASYAASPRWEHPDFPASHVRYDNTAVEVGEEEGSQYARWTVAVLVTTASYTEVTAGLAARHQPCREHQLAANLTSATGDAELCSPSSLPRHVSIISFISLVTYITAYSVSFGPISWILLSELFPLGVKARAMSLGQAVNWTANVVVSFSFMDMVHTFSLAAVFGFYLVMSLISLVFIYFYVPETKNKSLEEICRELGQEARGPAGGFQARHKTLSPLPAVKTSTAIHQQINMPLRVIQT